MAPTTVYLVVDSSDHAEAARVRPLALQLAARVADHLRAEFASSSSVQPLGMAEPRLTWHSLDIGLRVWAHRDGRVAWNDSIGDSLPVAGAKAIASALRALRDSSGRVGWPAGLTRDSVLFIFDLDPATVNRRGHLTVPKEGNPIPVFRVMHPWVEQVERRGLGAPRYPSTARLAGISAKLRFRAVVDTNGRVDPATVHLVAYTAQPGQTLLLPRYLEDFAESVKTFFSRGRYLPKRIAGCPVRQEINQWFEFDIDR